MKVLLTGGSGRLGHVTTKVLLENGHDVLSMTRRLVEVPNGVKLVVVDFDNDSDLEAVFKAEKPDAVVHMASVLGANCDSDVAQATKINVVLTRRLAELAHTYHTKKFIFISSAAVYKQTELTPTDETSHIEPLSMYGKTKLAAEQQLAEVAKVSDTTFVSLRVFNIYGPHFTESLINKLVTSSVNQTVSLVGYEDFYRDYVHVDDVVQAIMSSLDNLNTSDRYAIYNIASGKALSNKELIDKLKTKGIRIHYDVAGSVVSYSWGDITKAHNELSFEPQNDIRL